MINKSSFTASGAKSIEYIGLVFELGALTYLRFQLAPKILLKPREECWFSTKTHHSQTRNSKYSNFAPEQNLQSMQKLLFSLLLVGTLFTFSGCDTLKEIATEVLAEPTAEEIGRGLKEALTQGIGKGADFLAQKDGYYKSAYKILLPAEAQQVTSRLKVIPGFEKLEEQLLEKINRGAEDAASEAKPIFVSAIRGLTFQDATNILMGEKNAATSFLNRTTNQQLYDKFNPKIVSSLDKVGARELWKKAADAYNKIPLVSKKVNNDLDDYITREALKGLFSKVEEEERNIRSNISARPSELLKKVFAKQDRK
jgi:hypothetical protein